MYCFSIHTSMYEFHTFLNSIWKNPKNLRTYSCNFIIYLHFADMFQMKKRVHLSAMSTIENARVPEIEIICGSFVMRNYLSVLLCILFIHIVQCIDFYDHDYLYIMLFFRWFKCNMWTSYTIAISFLLKRSVPVVFWCWEYSWLLVDV